MGACLLVGLSLLSAELYGIPVDRLELEVKSDLTSLEDKDPIAMVRQAIFSLALSEEGVVLPTGVEGGTDHEFLLEQAPQGDYSLEALRSLQSQIVASLSQAGYYGIVVVADPDQIDLFSGEDLREGETSLSLQIWFSKVVLQRTVGKGDRIKGDEDLLNHPLHQAILEHSPFAFNAAADEPKANEADTQEVDEADADKADKADAEDLDESDLDKFDTKEADADEVDNEVEEADTEQADTDEAAAPVGFLIDKPALDNYIERLNQHPRRRVDVALSAAGEPGEVVLDYIVSESKPWTLYAQVSNTGTEATGDWRERIGGMYYQLTGNDDILNVDYLTAEFDQANAFLASYELPLLKPDYLKVMVYGSYSDFAAENLEIPVPDATGETITYGGELVYTPFYYKGHSISAIIGVKYEDIEVDGVLTAGVEGSVQLLSPYLRLEASREKQVHRSLFSVAYETNTDTSYDEKELLRLGRQESTVDHDLVQFNLYQSFFLEPLFPGYRQVQPDKWLANSLVHELAFSLRGQYALDDARLITQKQYYAGGFFSVRGYEESAARGDSGFVGSAEYRIHLARLLRPASLLEEVDPEQQAEDSAVRKRFNYRAPNLYGLPDWDLLVRGFVDWASVSFNDSDNHPQEVDQDLLSAGVGVEFQYEAHLNIRLDFGVVINELEDYINQPIEDAESGDTRLHVLATYSF